MGDLLWICSNQNKCLQSKWPINWHRTNINKWWCTERDHNSIMKFVPRYIYPACATICTMHRCIYLIFFQYTGFNRVSFCLRVERDSWLCQRKSRTHSTFISGWFGHSNFDQFKSGNNDGLTQLEQRRRAQHRNCDMTLWIYSNFISGNNCNFLDPSEDRKLSRTAHISH